MGKGAWSVVKKCSTIPPYVPPGATEGMKSVVKIIEKDYLISLTKGDVDRAMAEVKREIDVLRHIPPHENVVTFLEYVETEKHFLLFFEEVRCGDLCELILQEAEGKITEERSKLYTYQIIKAVLHCHLHDVIHRDIKPENLLVSEDHVIKLTDFGLAKRSKGVCTSDPEADPLDLKALMMPYPGCERLEGKHIKCSDVIGTPRYGAPEMFYAKFTQTHYDGFGADTWSIGVVTYITLSGSFPYSSSSTASEKEVFRTIMDSPLPHPSGITPLALDFLQCLLNKDPSKRIPLYAALNHPWLAEVVVPRGSVVATQLRAHPVSTETEQACVRFDDEARRLRQCLAKAQYEVQRLREERDRLSNNEADSSRDGTRTPPRRAQTPSGTASRPRTRSPGSSMRVASPHAGARQAASRDGSSSSLPHRSTVNSRTRSPLSRSAGGAAVRRGTPARSGSLSTRGGTPSRSGAARSGSSVRSSSATNRMAPSKPSSAGAAGPRTASATNRTRSRTPGSAGSAPAGAVSGANAANELHVGDAVVYKGYKAVVRFNGPTAFGAGIWIGLEMLEGNEGTNDGSSFIDKKQYFTCPKGKGLFVRASQVKKS